VTDIFFAKCFLAFAFTVKTNDFLNGSKRFYNGSIFQNNTKVFCKTISVGTAQNLAGRFLDGT